MKLLGRSALYKYYNEHGELLFERPKYRTDQPYPRHKVVTYRYGVGAGWASGGDYSPILIKEKHPFADAYLYRLPQLLTAVREGAPIWWTEGESDADALWNEYELCATSHHGGAGKIHPEQVEWFRGHTGLVFLCYDLDADSPRGGNVGAFDVVMRYDFLRSVGLRDDQIIVCHAAVGKDARDHLDSGRDPGSMISISDLTPLRNKAVLTISDGPAWNRLGYGPPDDGLLETIEAIENNPTWEYRA